MTKKLSCIIVFVLISARFISHGMGIEKEKVLTAHGTYVDAVKGQVLVKFRESATEDRKKQINGKFNIQAIDKFNITAKHPDSSQLMNLPPGLGIHDALNYYKNLPEVEFAEPNYIEHIFVVPDDPYYASTQWGLQKIRAEQAWNIITGSPNVIVAVIDTGIDYNHPDLAANVLASNGFDFINNDTNPMDDNGHGTHVSGIISAVADNGIGVAGVCWNVKLLPVKCLGADGEGDDFKLAAGIRYAADNCAKVINMSFGDTNYPPIDSITIRDACSYAYSKGCILVAASGNGYDTNNDDKTDRYDAVSYPAAYPFVIAVGATTSQDQRAYFSNYGPELDVMAPGFDIFSTVPGSIFGALYKYESGTSMAAPFVSGLAALLFSKNINMDQTSARDAILIPCEDIGYPGIDLFTGRGRINAYGTLTWQQPPAVAKAMNYPNPFNPKAGEKTFFTIPSNIMGIHTSVRIYNLAGELVTTLEKPGEVESTFAQWGGRNDNGDLVASGIYFYVIETENGRAKGKLTILKQ